MSRYRYTKFIPSPLDEIDLEDLMDQLRDLFLESGFYSQFFPQSENEGTLDDLYRALAEILSEEESVPEDWREEYRQYSEKPTEFRLSEEPREFLQALVKRLIEKGYIQPNEDSGGESQQGEASGPAEFELTEKGVDLLRYKTLRDLLGSRGSGHFGLHLTETLDTGVEADADSRPYEFGDTLNLDISQTLLNAVQREGLGTPINLEYSDLMVRQSERQSSCATVVMLDCSHSMILYGEDRFTPAKTVAMALAHLIRTQFPGDTLRVVLFHDSAEEIPLLKLPKVKVGPFHTNTSEGLRMARRILLDQRKEMRQIVMITDGKPSAVTMPGGHIYKNSFGLDPLILDRTFEEVARCRKSGIVINTFMLARDFHLVSFVKRVSQICRGKAYFATTVNLASYILMDFMNNKSKVVH